VDGLDEDFIEGLIDVLEVGTVEESAVESLEGRVLGLDEVFAVDLEEGFAVTTVETIWLTRVNPSRRQGITAL